MATPRSRPAAPPHREARRSSPAKPPRRADLAAERIAIGGDHLRRRRFSLEANVHRHRDRAGRERDSEGDAEARAEEIRGAGVAASIAPETHAWRTVT